jgi:hypothetical protein
VEGNFMRFARSIVAAFVLLTLIVGASGCSLRIGYVSRNSESRMSASFGLMSASKTKDVALESGEKMNLEFKAENKKGTLSLTVTGPDGVSYTDTVVGPASVTQSGVVEAQKAGTYTVKVTGQDANGRFDVSWTLED